LGADLHSSMEVLFDGKWFFVGALPSRRNYQLFGKLSGVRGDDGPFFEESSELPEDVCQEIKDDYEAWGSDAHSLTVIDYKDLEAFCDYFQKPSLNWCKLTAKERNSWSDKKQYDKHCAASYVVDWLFFARKLMSVGAGDVRVVIWYDN